MAETRFEDKTIMAPHRIEAFNEVHASIRQLNDGISNALDLSSIQKRFEDHAVLLKEKEQKLLRTVQKLELTKNTLSEEMHFREQEELRLNQIVSQLRTQKIEITARLAGYEHDVKTLQSEKEKLDALLNRLNRTISEMHGKVQEFKEIVRN